MDGKQITGYRGRGSGIETTTYKIDKKQGYIIQHTELHPLFCNNIKWSVTYKNTKSLCCTPETKITLYVNYNSKYKKEKGSSLLAPSIRKAKSVLWEFTIMAILFQFNVNKSHDCVLIMSFLRFSLV